ncbi:hypothetical protein BDF14DRAFT_1739727 [Spinellus fusiger]|nr:hypothetical protein BDF14DRAFT_1739727 [Spinellus fusiger]
MSSMSWVAGKSSDELIPMLKNAYSALKDKERDLVLAAEIGKSLLENNLRLKSSYEHLLHRTLSSVSSPSTEEEHLMPCRSTREAMTEVLEKKNAELNKCLETAMLEHERHGRTESKKQRKLETEINVLQRHLDTASHKIQELEEVNSRQAHRQKQKVETKAETIVSENNNVEGLLKRLHHLQTEHNEAQEAKAEVETELANTLKDLRTLKEQFEHFQFTQKDYETLKQAYERQFEHIEQLSKSLEEYRHTLQKLKSRGVPVSTASTSAPSFMKDSVRHTLLGELESEWLKTHEGSVKCPTAFDGTALKESSYLTYELRSLLSKTSGIDRHLLDEALSWIECLDVHDDDYPRESIYPDLSLMAPMEREQLKDKSFMGQMRRWMCALFHSLWRWCRFATVLTTAVLISVWNGPDKRVTY